MNINPSSVGHWAKPFNETDFIQWIKDLRDALPTPTVSVGFLFVSNQYVPFLQEISDLIRIHATCPLLLGCSSHTLIANHCEYENLPGLVLALHHFPDARLKAFHFPAKTLENAHGRNYWANATGIKPKDSKGWLLFADPFHLKTDSWIHHWNEAYESVPILGGLANSSVGESKSVLILNNHIYEEGCVALSVGGGIRLASVLSQSCSPIGEPWVVTEAKGHFINKLANQPALKLLQETYDQLPQELQANANGNIFIGLAADEYYELRGHGDFLIRSLLGANPHTGALAVATLPRIGQTVQFQLRSAHTATQDFEEILTRARIELDRTTVFGGCLCDCTSRGSHLFGNPNHDAALIEKHFGRIGLSGFFCNGEFGPIGKKHYVHGYSASLALFAGA